MDTLDSPTQSVTCLDDVSLKSNWLEGPEMCCVICGNLQRSLTDTESDHSCC